MTTNATGHADRLNRLNPEHSTSGINRPGVVHRVRSFVEIGTGAAFRVMGENKVDPDQEVPHLVVRTALRDAAVGMGIGKLLRTKGSRFVGFTLVKGYLHVMQLLFNDRSASIVVYAMLKRTIEQFLKHHGWYS